jgi:glucose/arabinose dehydrogenase
MRLRAALVAAVVTALCSGSATASDNPKWRIVKIVGGLDAPLQVTSTRSEPARLYIVEQGGLVLVRAKGKLLSTPFLDVRDLVSTGGERGLLSLAFHPNYKENHLFYVDYTNRSGDTEVVEYRANASGPPTRLRLVLTVGQPYPNHNGGQLAFGPDGKLYVGMGDGGSQDDPQDRAQDPKSLLGKLLRIDVGEQPATIEIAAFGLRNPWRFSFDRKNGDLWIGDVGGSDFEEVDYLAAGTKLPVNFGWDVYEGNEVHEQKAPTGGMPLVFPVAVYDHAVGCSITGGFVYRGSLVPAARGRYFYGDYCSGRVWSLTVDPVGHSARVLIEKFTVPSLSSLGEGPKGELYFVSLEGSIYRLSPI